LTAGNVDTGSRRHWYFFTVLSSHEKIWSMRHWYWILYTVDSRYVETDSTGTYLQFSAAM
jgi:hypothetical protein